MYQKIKKILLVYTGVLGIGFLLLFALLLQPVTLGAKGQSAEPKGFKFDFDRWPYPMYKEVSARLKELARKYPKLARTHNIGKSGEGRDLWVIEITNTDTGPGESKPAMWMDSGIHAGEVTGRPVFMYFVERLLASYGQNAEATRLVDTRTFYVMPIFDADGGERVFTRHPAWPGYKPEEHRGRDLDGDGYITSMRVKDPNGNSYKSPIDSRVMLRVRTREGSHDDYQWRYVPTTWDDSLFFSEKWPDVGWQPISKTPEPFEDELAPRDQRYRIYTEGESVEQPRHWRKPDGGTGEREPANFNRNWSAEWRPEEPGAGPFPFSIPDLYAVAKFITSRKNVFFDYSWHSGGGAKNYQVRPPMDHPYEFMPPEDNDFYIRLGAVWSALSGGGIMVNTWYSQELMAGRYGWNVKGFQPDWAYIHQGIHALSPEVAVAGKDYDGDGYVTAYETLRWNKEELGGKYFAPWKQYKHPVLGKVEIGGWRGRPSFGDRLEKECKVHYNFLLHIAGLSPLLRIKSLTSKRISDGKYRIMAIVQNQGWLATYVTRNAQKIKRDFPILARIKVTGGQVIEEKPLKNIGHILGKLSYYRRWGMGADESTKTVEWTIKATGAGPLKVSVEIWAHKAGRDQRTIMLKR